VHLDLRHLGEKVINSRIPFVRELCQKYQNVDPVREMIPVRPVVHYMMGGVSTDMNGATPLPGLYAAGEVACVSINGANRLGSNSLPELLVFGARAGRAAAEFASRQKNPVPGIQAQGADEKRRLEQELLRKTDGREKIATLREEMQKTMETSAGIYRTGAALSKATVKLRELRERARSLAIADHSRTFNTEIITALELTFGLEVASVVVQSALKREESRGAHQRNDFPARDDKRFLAHSLAFRQPDGSTRLEYPPVKITRWPPAERVYGK
jgi:fumarate reductase flavoprotein subunit